MSIDHTLSPADVAERLGTTSHTWLHRGVREGRYPCLRVPAPNGQRAIRFTEEHLEQIAATLEQPAGQLTTPPAAQPAVPAAEGPDHISNLGVFAPTTRSANRHRKPKTSEGGAR